MNKLLFILIFILGFIVVSDLFHPGLPITHDGQDHIARIANFYQNLEEGNVIPRWAPNLNWGYGHPILEFLYPLPSYIASFFHWINFSLVDSVKIVFGLGIVLSGFFMYLWLTQFLGPSASFVGAALYMLAPYRFINLYVRGDIGENLAFAFMPLALYFIFKLSRNIRAEYVAGSAVSICLLVLSHNAISLIYMPFVVFYGLFLSLSFKGKKEYLINFFSAVVLGLGLSAFFWIPGLLEAKYTLRNIVTAGSYIDRFVDFKALLYGPWNYGGTGQFTIQLGIIQWVSVVFSLLVLLKKTSRDYILTISLLFYTFIAIFIMLPQASFIWEKFIILQNFQFPWRFLAITVFSSAVLAALIFNKIPAKAQKIFLLLFVIALLFLSRDYWHANGYLQKPESFFTGIYDSTTDTGESAPIWSVRFMEKRPKSHMEVIGGKASFKQLDRNSTRHSYEVEAMNNIQLRENTIYFPGWRVLVDGRQVPIEFQSGVNRGVITFFVSKGKHIIDVEFSETKLRFLANLVSGASLIFVLFYNVLGIKLWRRFL